MIALDTNILVRYFVQDDPVQSKLAADFLEGKLSQSNQGFVSTVALLELNWVLQYVYSVDRNIISRIFLKLLAVPNLVIEASSAVRAAFRLEDQSFSDALIHEIGKAQGCTHTLTFDKRFSRLVGVELLTD
jgi:predicted nucleic-acid-binding protein